MESKFVKPNEEVSFTCRSIGYPRPEISFMFLPCLEVPWRNCSASRTNKDKWDVSSIAGFVAFHLQDFQIVHLGLL